MSDQSRRKCSALFLATLVAGWSLLGVKPGHAAERANPPNIVLILADDLGYGDVQCLNPRRGKIPTPHLDRLAREGMIFTDAHSGSSVCTPTRYGILTGRYAWRTRLQRGVLNGNQAPLIAADRLTLPGLLRQHGYSTACIGKWHLGFTVSDGSSTKAAGLGAVTADGPTTRGFDTFLGFQHARSMQAFFHDQRVAEQVEPIDMLPKLARLAAEHLAQQAGRGQPFFLYFALSSPHTPIVPSRQWQGKSGLGPYGDFVMQTDWAVGEVLSTLEKADVADNTLLIFTSDNGCSPAAGVEKLKQQGHYASAELRGYKSDIWEGGHRVPFLARWPGQVKPGATSSQLLCLTDVMATVAEIVGARLPASAAEDSFSFLPVILGAGASERTSVVHHSIEGRFAIREGETKLALCSGSGGWSQGQTEGEAQLYDLSSDLGERTNLASSRPDEVRRLRSLLEQFVAQGRTTPGKPQQNDVKVRLRPGRQDK